MFIYTYTVLHDDSEIGFAEAESFEDARMYALEDVPEFYPRAELHFIAIGPGKGGGEITVTGPCYFH